MGCSYGLMVCHVGYNSSPYPGPGQNIYQKIKKIFINKLLYLEKKCNKYILSCNYLWFIKYFKNLILHYIQKSIFKFIQLNRI